MSSQDTSASIAQRLAQAVPGGVNSNVRLEVADIVFARGQGPRLWDADGREYIDYVLGQGPAFLGHAHPRMLQAVTEAVQAGMTYAAQSPIELLAAERILKALDWAEMVRIGMTSTETVQAALRLARSATGRPLFMRFRGQYHGWLDNVLASPAEPWPGLATPGQVPAALNESITLEWNDISAVERAFAEHPGQIAAIITEPIMLNAGAILPEADFLQGLRSLADRHGSVLIFDETITGFRIDLRGAVGRFGVVPDLGVYGKAVAGGFPASVLAGRADLMALFANGTNHSGTFNANVMSCAAISEAMAIMSEEAVHERVESLGRSLIDGLRTLFAASDLPIQVRGLPAAFHLSFDSADPVTCYQDLLRADTARYKAFVVTARECGLWLASRGIWYVSASHTQEIVEQTLDRMKQTIAVTG